MRRIIHLLVVATMLAMLTVAMAAPAFARPEHPTCCSTFNSARGGDNPLDVGYHVVGINNGGKFNIHSHPKWG